MFKLWRTASSNGDGRSRGRECSFLPHLLTQKEGAGFLNLPEASARLPLECHLCRPRRAAGAEITRVEFKGKKDKNERAGVRLGRKGQRSERGGTQRSSADVELKAILEVFRRTTKA